MTHHVAMPQRPLISHSFRLLGLLAGLACLISILGVPRLAQAQFDAEADVPSEQQLRPTRFELSTGFEGRFKADIDDGGEVSETIFPVRLGYNANLSDAWRLGIRFTYVYHRFDFSDSTGLGGPDPWEHIHLFLLTFPVAYRLTPEWTLAVIPLLKITAESGADFDQGVEGGGLVAAIYNFGPNLSLGLAVGGLSQIEDDATAIILPIIRWQIKPELLLATRPDPERGYSAQLTYSLSRSWQAGFGVGLLSDRFRLDDDGVAPKGVGESTSVPLWASIAYVLDDILTFELYAGVVVGRELRLEDENGNRISKQDVDPAPMLGVLVKAEF